MTEEGIQLLMLWAVTGALIGAAGSPFAFRAKGYDARIGVLLGMVMGAIANLLVLIPLWLLLPTRFVSDPGEIHPAFTIHVESLTLDEAALKYPENRIRYLLIDAASETAFLQVTDFQLEYLKSRMIAPRRESEGWFFIRRFLPLIDGDSDSLDEEAQERRAEIDSYRDAPPGDTTLPINRLEQEVLILHRKAYELRELHDALEMTLGEDDAFEIEWRDYTPDDDQSE